VGIQSSKTTISIFYEIFLHTFLVWSSQWVWQGGQHPPSKCQVLLLFKKRTRRLKMANIKINDLSCSSTDVKSIDLSDSENPLIIGGQTMDLKGVEYFSYNGHIGYYNYDLGICVLVK
jgi:hypothetical protein